MDVEEKKISLEEIVADRKLIESLFTHGKISAEAREYALSLLYPNKQWALWLSRLFLGLGITLILAGLIYFFAFNWTKITDEIKLISIQLFIITSLASAYYISLEKMLGQIFLLSASILVGIFLAVFGQIYQTGADSYQLFMMWSIFIFGFTVISNFAPQWVAWLIITNIFLMLWWEQETPYDGKRNEIIIYLYLMFLNGFALILREYFAAQNIEWLSSKWTRFILLITFTIVIFTPAAIMIVYVDRFIPVQLAVGSIGLIAHAACFYIYRFKFADLWALSITILSLCILAEIIIVTFLEEVFSFNRFAYDVLILGIATLIIFSFAVIYLRSVIQKVEAQK